MSVSPVSSYVNKQGGFTVLPIEIIEGVGAPSTAFKRPVGAFYYDTTTQSLYGSGGVVNNLAVWIALGGSSVAISNVVGTANQVTSSVVGGVATLSLPAALQAPGSVSAGTTITAGTDLASTAGNVLINGSAKQLRVKGGAATDFIGDSVLVAGTVTILNTNIAAGDQVYVTRYDINGSTAIGMFETTITPATSFTINARKADATIEANDVSKVKYFIVRAI